MEASSSSNTTNIDLTVIEVSVVDKKMTKISSTSVGGRKSEELVADLVIVSSDEESVETEDFEVVEDYDESMEEESLEEDSDDEEEEYEDEDERSLILEETMKLKKLVGFFFHPEKPVAVDGTAAARDYFSQPWACEQESPEDVEQRELLLADLSHLNKVASAYQHPELPVHLEDPLATARNYFERPSGSTPTSTLDEGAVILQEMMALKQLTSAFMHPEKPVQVDPTSFGRNYFTRPAAQLQGGDYADDGQVILEEIKQLKELSFDYRHPEAPLKVNPVCFGRNYFARPSATEDTAVESRERALILQEARMLKSTAVDYLHPEAPIASVDATLFGRNYYGRPSAERSEVEEDEGGQVLSDCQELKRLAADYKHPEKPVQVHSCAPARNFFVRPSAGEQLDEDHEAETQSVLQEIAALKQRAIDFQHPELPVSVDPMSFGRNFFSRPSAAEQDTFGRAEGRARVVSDASKLKSLVVDYMHPERSIQVGAGATGRNYFTRSAAFEYETDSEFELDEREQILRDASNLKKFSVDFLHPERSLEVDPTVFGRNYFSRVSAPKEADEDDADELIQEDVRLLKRAAFDFMHPESPMEVDPTVFGRNYFYRAAYSAQDSFDYAAQKEYVLQDAAALKKAARDYSHPERPLPTPDASMFGRNYFLRPSGSNKSFLDEEEERTQVLADVKALKKLSLDYLHPECPLEIDSTTLARSYFSAASSPDQESPEYVEERAQVFEEASALKKLATDYMHPEAPVHVDAMASARSYYSRASAPDQESPEDSDESTRILAEASALKKLAVDYLHPEIAVATADPNACGRNYFARASAVGVAEHISTSGFATHLGDNHSYAEEHSHHDDYGHFDMDEEMFYDMRQTMVLPGDTNNIRPAAKVQSSKISSDEEGELSRSPSSVMLFTGALEDAGHPPLPTMG